MDEPQGSIPKEASSEGSGPAAAVVLEPPAALVAAETVGAARIAAGHPESPRIPDDRRIEALLRPMTTAMVEPNAYLRTKILTASPVELRLLLFDGAIRFLRHGIEGLVARDFERMYEGVSRTQSIVLELLNALDKKQAPELCERLSGLYTFMYLELVEGHSTRDEARLREVLRLLEFERETWVMLMERLAAGDDAGDPASADSAPGRSAAAPGGRAASPPAPSAGAPNGSTLSVRG